MRQKKSKERKRLPLIISLPAFGFFWFYLLLFSIGMFSAAYNTILHPTLYSLFILPILGAIWFLLGFITLRLATEVNREIKKRREDRRKNDKKKKH